MRTLTVTAARIVALVLTAGALVAPGALAAGERSTGVPTAVTDRIIVQWEPGVTRGDRLDARADADAAFVRTLGAPEFQLVRPEPGQGTADAIAALRADPAVHTAMRDGWSVLHATTNDPLYSQLWGLLNGGAGVEGFLGAIAGADIDVQAAWDRTRGTPTTVIADLDAGYRFDAPDLAAVAWSNPADPPGGGDNDGNGIVDDSRGADFVGVNAQAPAIDGNPTDDNLSSGGHGIHTAGTMAAAGNNGVGISGVAQNVRIMPLRVCAHDASEGDAICPFSSQILAINYAGSHGARAANMSLGGLPFRPDVQAAIAANPNVLFVISAGNDAQDNDVTPHYPCAYPLANIVCVAATDQADQLADFSDWGLTSVDLAAPGTETFSVYPSFIVPFSEGFALNDFASKWSTTGGTGFARATVPDGPLTSAGMNDSPGVAPAAGSLHETTLTTGATIPAGTGSCTLTGRRFVSQGTGGDFTYTVLSNNVGVSGFTGIAPADTSGSAMIRFSTAAIPDLAGTSVKVRFSYTAGGSPSPANGVWLDDLELECYASLATPPTYDFLEGTSMAAPHVTGAAGLLFSLKPSASVAEVKGALLGTVEPRPGLAGKTVTGGRLNVAAALDRLVPPDTAITSGPATSNPVRSATFAFKRADAALPATFECRLDGAPFTPCTTPETYVVALGAHTFQVRGKDARGNVDASPATYGWTYERCLVPKLKGKSLKQAKRALKKAGCALGKVVKPKKRKGKKLPPLIVKSSKPKARTVRSAGTKVKLTMKAKPPKRKPARRR